MTIRSSKTWLATIVLFGCVSGFSHAALFSISKPTFCGYVNPDTLEITSPASGEEIRRSTLPNRLLHFYCIIVGDQTTYDYLNEHRHLELHASIWADGTRYDSVEFGISTRRWEQKKEKLKDELDEFGFFTFRTFMNTQKIWYSEIQLVLKDDNNKVVSPVGFSGSYRARIKLRD